MAALIAYTGVLKEAPTVDVKPTVVITKFVIHVPAPPPKTPGGKARPDARYWCRAFGPDAATWAANAVIGAEITVTGRDHTSAFTVQTEYGLEPRTSQYFLVDRVWAPCWEPDDSPQDQGISASSPGYAGPSPIWAQAAQRRYNHPSNAQTWPTHAPTPAASAWTSADAPPKSTPPHEPMAPPPEPTPQPVALPAQHAPGGEQGHQTGERP